MKCILRKTSKVYNVIRHDRAEVFHKKYTSFTFKRLSILD